MMQPLRNVSMVWAIALHGLMKPTTAVETFCNANMYQGLEPMDDSYIKRTNHLFPVVLRNKAKNAAKIHKHLLWQARNNRGEHQVSWGNRRMTVAVKMLGGNHGPHNTKFQQTIIRTERFTGRGKKKEWKEVTQEEWVEA